MIDPNQHDQFVLRQKATLVINRYFFSVAGQEDTPFCFVEQKRFAFKEDIRFFADEPKTEELMRIKARHRFDPRATYDVTVNGERIGQIQNVFGASLFVFKRGDVVVGHNRRRRWKLVDVYDIDLSLDPQRTLDRRLALALSVGKDAFQAR